MWRNGWKIQIEELLAINIWNMWNKELFSTLQWTLLSLLGYFIYSILYYVSLFCNFYFAFCHCFVWFCTLYFLSYISYFVFAVNSLRAGMQWEREVIILARFTATSYCFLCFVFCISYLVFCNLYFCEECVVTYLLLFFVFCNEYLQFIKSGRGKELINWTGCNVATVWF